MHDLTPYLASAMGIIAILALAFTVLILYLQLKKNGFAGDTRCILVVNVRLPVGVETRLDQTRVRSPEHAQEILDGYVNGMVLGAYVFDPVEDTVIASMDSNGHLRNL